MGMACRRWYGLCVLILCLGILGLGATQSYGRTPQRKAEAKSTLRFEAKRGQTDEPVQYVARSADFSLFLTGEEADVVLHHECEPQGPVSRGKVIVVNAYADVLRLRFVDANPPTEMAPVGGFPSSPKPSRGQGRRARPGKHPSYAGVAYLGIYPGTDLVFHGTQHRIGFELYFSPGADPNAVVLRLDGATGITLDHSGNAVVHIGTTSLVLEKPSFYTGRGIGRQLIPGGFKIEPNNRLRFLVSLPKRGGNLIED